MVCLTDTDRPWLQLILKAVRRTTSICWDDDLKRLDTYVHAMSRGGHGGRAALTASRILERLGQAESGRAGTQPTHLGLLLHWLRGHVPEYEEFVQRVLQAPAWGAQALGPAGDLPPINDQQCASMQPEYSRPSPQCVKPAPRAMRAADSKDGAAAVRPACLRRSDAAWLQRLMRGIRHIGKAEWPMWFRRMDYYVQKLHRQYSPPGVAKALSQYVYNLSQNLPPEDPLALLLATARTSLPGYNSFLLKCEARGPDMTSAINTKERDAFEGASYDDDYEGVL